MVDISLVIRHRLNDLDLEQRDLATAANVTESYISQLLTGKKAPPAAHRTDIYEKMEAFLKLPSGELSKLADIWRIEEAGGPTRTIVEGSSRVDPTQMCHRQGKTGKNDF